MKRQTHLRNIGIVAHVDAGKTTTTEHILYESGKIRSLGRVDNGTAHTDWLDVERERGISVRAAASTFEWKGCAVNLIDTPGHVDFSSEVERSLRVLDGAILIVSAVEGIQAHTETLWHALHSMKIPTLIYVNKVDRVGVDLNRVLRDIRQTLTPDAVPIETADGEGPEFTSVIALGDAVSEQTQEMQMVYDSVYEKLAEKDEELFERYVQGSSLPLADLFGKLVEQVHNASVYPVLYGSSLKGIGISPLLDALVTYLPAPIGDEDGPVSGVVFKIERHKTHGRVAFVRLYSGTMKNRDIVVNSSRRIEEKVTQIRKVNVQQHVDVGELFAGDIAAVYGLNQSCIGDILGDGSAVPSVYTLSEALLTVRVNPQNDVDYAKLAAALVELDDEDPALHLEWLKDERELHVRVIGRIQLEILERVLLSRFGLSVQFSAPSVIYKETPSQVAEGFVAYTMPKPCWAILRFRIEPGKPGSGLYYESLVRTENLLQSYQNEVAKRVPEALQQGLYGWEVVDLRVTLVEGEHHVWHTHPLDFVIATPMGMMDGLRNTGTQLLEPILKFRITAPEQSSGRIMSDLSQMRAEFDNPVIAGALFTVEGTIPLATSLDYAVNLGIITSGRGTFSTRFFEYRPCPPTTMVTRPRRGVNPLDTSKYILSVRNALSRES